MRMAVAQRLVGVSVRVRLAGRRRGVVLVLVVLVVLVPMLVLHPPRRDRLARRDHGANERRC